MIPQRPTGDNHAQTDSICFGNWIGPSNRLRDQERHGTSTNPNKPSETRKLSITAMDSHSITQDKTVDFTVHITRDNFKEPVLVEVNELPRALA